MVGKFKSIPRIFFGTTREKEMTPVINKTQVKEMLVRMKDEVEDLHPVLRIIFDKMPGVKECEYTHGNDEWGADFVLTVEDTVLGGIEHVGVIAKRGGIKQDFHDLDRQIDECKIKRRKVRGGIKEVELDRIWIVATGSISQNAKEKLYEKYRASGITVIDGSKLSELIEKYAPFIYEDITPEIGEYLKKLQNQIEGRREQRDLLSMDGNTPEIELEIVELKT